MKNKQNSILTSKVLQVQTSLMSQLTQPAVLAAPEQLLTPLSQFPEKSSPAITMSSLFPAVTLPRREKSTVTAMAVSINRARQSALTITRPEESPMTLTNREKSRSGIMTGVTRGRLKQTEERRGEKSTVTAMTVSIGGRIINRGRQSAITVTRSEESPVILTNREKSRSGLMTGVTRGRLKLTKTLSLSTSGSQRVQRPVSAPI